MNVTKRNRRVPNRKKVKYNCTMLAQPKAEQYRTEFKNIKHKRKKERSNF